MTKKTQKQKTISSRIPVISILSGSCLLAYLFVSAPPPLELDNHEQAQTIPISTALTILATENASARKLYTQEIVSKGLDLGWEFSEDWNQSDVNAGPLPALFLRQTARSIERDVLPIGLFLGSNYPIESSNKFSGIQASHFETMINSQQSEHHFYSEDTKLYTSMFTDIAINASCVDCHNQHAQSAKTNWRMMDIMGATTWTYPKSHVSARELIQMISVFRTAVRSTWIEVLEESKTWPNSPAIGEYWPRSGYYLPDETTFMNALESDVSRKTLQLLLEEHNRDEA